jgi:hypothetical protein
MRRSQLEKRFNFVALDYADLDHTRYEPAGVQNGVIKHDIYVGELPAR